MQRSTPSPVGDVSSLWAQAREYHRKGEAKRAIELYEKSAQQGDVRAFNSLGVCHMTGFGVKKVDQVLATKLFQKGATAGDASAMFNLANAYERGEGVPQEKAKAFEWYTKAAKLNEFDAVFHVGLCYLEGIGIERNQSKAYEYFKDAVDRGCDKAINYLGVCVAEGHGCKKDVTKANELFELAASKNDPKGMYNLAIACQNGLGMPQDLKRSFELHLKGAQQGYLSSLVMMGVFYQKGLAVLVDDKKAVELFQQASDKGCVEAMNHLGFCYLSGRGVSADQRRAFTQFKRSAELNDPTGLCNLAHAYLNGFGVNKHAKKGVECFQRAVELGSADALYGLALCYADGTGVPQDSSKAAELLTRAAEKRSTKALFTRGQWLEQGRIFQKDMTLCLESYRKAFLAGHREAGQRYRELIVETLPESIKHGPKKQLERFVDDLIDSGSMKWAQAKVMVLGKEGVGKTALYHQIRGKPYANNLSTDGIDVHSFRVKDMELIWFDFGGQTIFYPTHQFFLTSRCIYLLCFKFGDEDSVERVKYWLQDVHYLTRNPSRPVKLLVIGTHADAMPNVEQQNAVWASLQSAMNSVGHVVALSAVSCKAGTGIESVLQGIKLALEQSKLRELQVPKSYGMIEHFIKEIRPLKPRMDWEELRLQFPSLAERVVDQAFEFFTDVGLCIFDRKLGIFISDPQWLAKTFSTLISFAQQWVKNGVVTLENLSHVWKGLDPKEVEQMMFLLEKFGVAFLKRMDRCWIVPSLLVDQNQDPSLFVFGPPSSEVVLKERSFALDFIPFGMFGRLIARFHAWCEETGKAHMSRTWQTGIILKSSDGHWVQITLDAEQKALELKFVGSQKASTSRLLTVGNRPQNEKTSPRLGIRASLPDTPSVPTATTPQPPPRKSAQSVIDEQKKSPRFQDRASTDSLGRGKPLPRRPLRGGVDVASNSLKAQSVPSSPIPVKDGDARHLPSPRSVSPTSSPSRSPRPPSPRPSTWCRAQRVKDDGFMRDVVEQVHGLLETVLDATVSPSSVCVVACPHCLSDLARYRAPTFFALTHCVEAVINAGSRLSCRGVDVPIESFDEDITFHFVTIFREDEVSIAEKPFASGGFGNIFKAELLVDGQTVVAKELKPEKVKESFDELQKETSVMSRLHHANIVQLFGITIHPMRMILEFCPEGDLLHGLRGNRVTSNELRYKIALDIAKGVAFLHAQKPPLAHRDLRSPNVLLCSLNPTHDICAKVADFGLTLAVTERLRDPLSTWQWMAPEAQLGDFYTEACDLYSFGIILFEICQGTGEIPFTEFASKLRMIEMFPKIRSGNLRPTLPQNVAPWMRTLIENLWSSVATIRPPAHRCVSILSEKCWVVSDEAIRVVDDVHERPAEEIILNELVIDLCLGRCVYAITPSRVVALDPLSLEEIAFPEIPLAQCATFASGCVWIGTQDARLVGVQEKDLLICSSMELFGEVRFNLALTPTLILIGDDIGCLSLISVSFPEGPAILSALEIGRGNPLTCGCIIHGGLAWVADSRGVVYEVTLRGDEMEVTTVCDCGTEVVALVFPGGNNVWCCFAEKLCVFDVVLQQRVLSFPLTSKCFGAEIVGDQVWVGHAGFVSIWDSKKRYRVGVVDLRNDDSIAWRSLQANGLLLMSEWRREKRGVLIRLRQEGVPEQWTRSE